MINLEQIFLDAKKESLKYSSRVALFAYRVKETAFLNDKATSAMIPFFNMPQPRTVDMSNGFLFVRHPYPEVYKW